MAGPAAPLLVDLLFELVFQLFWHCQQELLAGLICNLQLDQCLHLAQPESTGDDDRVSMQSSVGSMLALGAGRVY